MALSSGTAAIHLGLLALGIGPGVTRAGCLACYAAAAFVERRESGPLENPRSIDFGTAKMLDFLPLFSVTCSGNNIAA